MKARNTLLKNTAEPHTHVDSNNRGRANLSIYLAMGYSVPVPLGLAAPQWASI